MTTRLAAEDASVTKRGGSRTTAADPRRLRYGARMKLLVAKQAATSLRRGHPWVYRDAIPHAPRSLEAGAVVELVDETGAGIGQGLWDPSSPIAVRIHERRTGRPLDVRSFDERLERAFALRDAMFGSNEQTTAYRLCNGEGDRVPGLVVDRYGDVAVLRFDGDAIRSWADRLVPVVVARLSARGVRSILVRVDAGAGERKSAVVHGPMPPDRVLVRERGMTMEVDLARGQKTGAFLDQRENRARVRRLAEGRARALNLYSYAGGFSIAAALGGAAHVTSVDVAAAAHATAQRSFRENGIDPRAHAFVSADVPAFLEQAKARGERFDLVISDPPSFAPSERARERALAAYRRLHAAIAAILTERAIFCAASCSSHVTHDDFLATLDDATLGRSDLRVTHVEGPPADHPVLPAWSEGRYLKFIVLS